jgi:hypothetical protein
MAGEAQLTDSILPSLKSAERYGTCRERIAVLKCAKLRFVNYRDSSWNAGALEWQLSRTPLRVSRFETSESCAVKAQQVGTG